MAKAKTPQEQTKLKKLFLTKEETAEVQNRRGVAVYLHNLLMHDIQNYLTETAFLRLKLPKYAKVRVSDDATYLEVDESDNSNIVGQ